MPFLPHQQLQELSEDVEIFKILFRFIWFNIFLKSEKLFAAIQFL